MTIFAAIDEAAAMTGAATETAMGTPSTFAIRARLLGGRR
jgi:hypothetical protein